MQEPVVSPAKAGGQVSNFRFNAWIPACAGITWLLNSSFVHAASWGKNRLWGDGRAEVAVYDAERIVDDKPRQFRETLITAKEELREDTRVKADDPKKQKTLRVFKMNVVAKIDNENYPYNYLTSVFAMEEPVQTIVKMTVGAQDWVGNTFIMYKGNTDGAGGTLSWNSYVDGEADPSTELALQKDDYFEDQLPLSLRALPFKDGFEKKVRVWDSLTSNRGAAPLVADAALKVISDETVYGHAGGLNCWVVTLTRPAGKDTYWFEKAAPNILVKMETHDGRKRTLYGRSRWKYWDKRIPRPNILK